MELYRVKYWRRLRTRKYILEHKCEWNLSLEWWFFVTVIFYLIVLIERSLHTHSKPWQHFQSVCLSLAVGQTEHLTWEQNDPVGLKKNSIHKKQYMCWMVFILCQWDFSEQIEKSVRLLLYTSEKCSRKFHTWVHFVPSQ